MCSLPLCMPALRWLAAGCWAERVEKQCLLPCTCAPLPTQRDRKPATSCRPPASPQPRMGPPADTPTPPPLPSRLCPQRMVEPVESVAFNVMDKGHRGEWKAIRIRFLREAEDVKLATRDLIDTCFRCAVLRLRCALRLLCRALFAAPASPLLLHLLCSAISCVQIKRHGPASSA